MHYNALRDMNSCAIELFLEVGLGGQPVVLSGQGNPIDEKTYWGLFFHSSRVMDVL